MLWGFIPSDNSVEWSLLWSDLGGLGRSIYEEDRGDWPDWRGDGQRRGSGTLAAVAAQGYIDDYSGIRIAQGGRRFQIRNATVWNLLGGQGQAALFSEWQEIESP